MKALILAGGLGTRLSEETVSKPKPMVEIGGMPILWHIMKQYANYGIDEFVILLGYKGLVIKEFFNSYLLRKGDVTFDFSTGKTTYHGNSNENWKVTLIDTGAETMTGARVRKARELVGENRFALTYGDGVCDLDMYEQIKFHEAHGGAVTMTSVRPDGRFGTFESSETNKVTKFVEKPSGEGAWINGGYFICEPEVFDFLEGDDNLIFEQAPLQNLASSGNLFAYRHLGFWKCMDTLKDKKDFNDIWTKGNAPWKTWS